MKLLSYNNTKTQKGEAFGYLTYILHLAPHNLSGHNVCPMASKGCAMACLNTAGMGKFSNVQQARINKTKLFFSDNTLFINTLIGEITKAKAKAAKLGMKLAIRLNGTSDIKWEKYIDMGNLFPDATFYDYTKNEFRDVSMHPNYTLVYSRKETDSDEKLQGILAAGGRVAVVFKGDTLPSEYLGYPVVDGDVSDLRFLDPAGCVVGLKAKGKAKSDTSGFVVNIAA